MDTDRLKEAIKKAHELDGAKGLAFLAHCAEDFLEELDQEQAAAHPKAAHPLDRIIATTDEAIVIAFASKVGDMDWLHRAVDLRAKLIQQRIETPTGQ